MCGRKFPLAGLALALGMKRTYSVSPTRLKCSRQTGSRPHRQSWQQASEAEEGEDAGSVLSPEIGIVADCKDKLPGNRR